VQEYGQAPGWVNGLIPIDNSQDANADGQIYIDINDPVPFNLVGMTTRFALSEV
jgi:hypothetical protein